MLKFYLMTDTHFYSTAHHGLSDDIGQITRNESGAIIDAAFEAFIAQDETDILLLCGDVTCNGRACEHEGFIEKLRRVKAAGKRVYMIPATHDYGQVSITDTPQNGRKEDAVYRCELRGMYEEFGFSEAIAEYDSMTYLVQLAPGYRLLCLNDDGDGRSYCGYSVEQLAWIIDQIAKAKGEGQFIFAMTHHPVLPPSPIYPIISRRDMLGGFEQTSAALADAGLRFIFTGHTHMQNIAVMTTEKGNKFYDINTGSLIGYPAPYRKVTVGDESMTVETCFVDDFDWDLQGKTAKQYLMDSFDALLVEILRSAAEDVDRFAELAGGFSVEKETVYKYKTALKLGGKLLNSLTFGGVGTLLCCRRRVDKSVRGRKLNEAIVEIIRNAYEGDEPYSGDTPAGKAILAFAERIGQLLRLVTRKSLPFDLTELVASVIYDDTPDNFAVLPRY